MENNSIDISCSKCKKKRANTEVDAYSLFGINKITNKWYKQCVTCREKYNAYCSKKSKTAHKCQHGHFKKSCSLCVIRCVHGKFPNKCFACRPELIKRVKCEHNLFKFSCRLCNLCIHDNHKKKCKQCVIDEYLKCGGTKIETPLLIKDCTMINV